MTNNAHTEGENRKPSRLRFFLRLVLSIAVIAYCVFLNIKRCSITAFADSYTLDPQASLGLFGDEISGVYYRQSNSSTHEFTAHFAGYYSSNFPSYSSDRRLYPSNGGGHWDDTINILWWFPRDPTADVSQSVSSEVYLIYLAYFSSIETSSQIAPYPNITLDIDFGIDFNAYSFDTNILFSRSSSARDSGWSSARLLGSVPTIYNQMYPSGDGYGFSVNTPYPAYIDGETEAVQLGCIPCAYPPRDNSLSTLYTYSGIQCRLNGVESSFTAPVGNEVFILYLQCPTIVSDSPIITTAPVTSTAPATTRPPYTGDGVTTPLFTYDLSPIETNQEEQIRIQNENLQYVAGIFEGMNIIIGQLHDIYNKMVANGEIPVDLLPGYEWQIDSDVNDFVQNHITYTVASMNWNNVYRPVTGFYNMFQEYNFLDSFAVLGGISLAFGVFCWFVFKGRGG